MNTLPAGFQATDDELDRRLSEARHTYEEHPEQTLAQARQYAAQADVLGDEVLKARALALECVVAMHRGEMREALTLALDADRIAGVNGDLVLRSELAAALATLRFFAGSLAEAIRQADVAVEAADESGDLRLRVYARGVAAMVFGTVGVRDRLGRFQEMLQLSTLAEDEWHMTLAMNNIACHHQEVGDQELAERWITDATALARRLPGVNSFALSVVSSTQADIHLTGGRPSEALECAQESLRLLATQSPTNPYVYGASVRAEVHALTLLGEHEAARTTGEAALEWLGERLPRARAQVLISFAQALREAGRAEAAYDALQRAFELERQTFSELSELQQILERATFEARAARKEADRDWLTGLYNRRFLAREIERLGSERRADAVSVAAIDLDHFKAVNDRFGHSVGDRVLTRAAALVTQLTRETDIAVRSGGEEFLILMPHTETDAAVTCCRRIHDAIRREDWNGLADGLRVTISVGVAAGDSGIELPAVIAAADHNLYAAKKAGRDGVVG